jgi:hypothetical protein
VSHKNICRRLGDPETVHAYRVDLERFLPEAFRAEGPPFPP